MIMKNHLHKVLIIQSIKSIKLCSLTLAVCFLISCSNNATVNKQKTDIVRDSLPIINIIESKVVDSVIDTLPEPLKYIGSLTSNDSAFIVNTLDTIKENRYIFYNPNGITKDFFKIKGKWELANVSYSIDSTLIWTQCAERLHLGPFFYEDRYYWAIDSMEVIVPHMNGNLWETYKVKDGWFNGSVKTYYDNGNFMGELDRDKGFFYWYNEDGSKRLELNGKIKNRFSCFSCDMRYYDTTGILLYKASAEKILINFGNNFRIKNGSLTDLRNDTVYIVDSNQYIQYKESVY